MQAARLVVDVANRRVWSRRPESATTGSINPNPELSIFNDSVHSCVAMTEPQNTHRVVAPRSTAFSPEGLDIKTCRTRMPPLSASQATTQRRTDQRHNGTFVSVPVSWKTTKMSQPM